MTEKILYGTYKERAGENVSYDMTLEYYLTWEMLCETYSDLRRYGITIRKVSEHPDGKRFEESKQIKDIFYRRQDAYEFMDMLIKNHVTPTGFRDVVEEYLTRKLMFM